METRTALVIEHETDRYIGAVVRHRVGADVTYAAQYDVTVFNHHNEWNARRLPEFFPTLDAAEIAGRAALEREG